MTRNAADYSGRVEPRSTGHADGSDDPHACRTCKSADAVTVVENEPSAEKANSLHDIGSYLSAIGSSIACKDPRQKREKRAAHTDEHVGPQPGSLTLEFALESNEASQRRRQPPNAQLPPSNTPDLKLQPREAEWLPELCQCCHSSVSLPDAITAQARLLRLSHSG